MITKLVSEPIIIPKQTPTKINLVGNFLKSTNFPIVKRKRTPINEPIKETLRRENPLEPSLMAQNMHTKKEEVVLIPRTLGDDKGLRVDPCTSKPAKAKEAPAKNDIKTLGSLTSLRICKSFSPIFKGSI